MSRLASRRVLATAAAAASVALLASACGKSSPQSAPASTATSPAKAVATPVAAAASPSVTATAPAGPQYAAGTPLISDGSDTVTIGGTAVQFPTKVSEAAWSPDGSRIAFIDGSGNVATARPDGSSLVVLVKPDQGAKLSTPVWQDGVVLYTEQNAAGKHFVRQAQAVGQQDHQDGDLYFMDSRNTEQVVDDTSNPTAAEDRNVERSINTLVFQAKGPKGPELWFHESDSNRRGGANPASKAADGSWPALSGDGRLAFVGSGGQIDVRSAPAWGEATATPKKIGDGAADATHLVWTPDHMSIAYSTADGIQEIPVDQPGATPKQVSAKPGVVSFLPAATDKVVTLSGNSPTDLVGASIAVSQHHWLTQTGATAQAAGGGARGPWALSAAIVAADDPAAAAKELPWAGSQSFGPALLTTGTGALDPRLTAELKRVLGRSNSNGPATVYLVGTPGAIPASADAAITALGYKPVRVTTAPKADPVRVPLAPIAIVDQGDTAATTEAKAEGCKVLTLVDGKVSASDAATISSSYPQGLPRIIAFGDKAFTAAASLSLKDSAIPVEVLGTTHADFVAATAALGPLTLVPSTSPADTLLAALATPEIGYLPYGASTVVVDPAQGISPTLKALLDARSASVDEIDVIDTGSHLPADTVKQLSTLISGPLGSQTVANQTADDVDKAAKKH